MPEGFGGSQILGTERTPESTGTTEGWDATGRGKCAPVRIVTRVARRNSFGKPSIMHRHCRAGQTLRSTGSRIERVLFVALRLSLIPRLSSG